MGFTKLTSFSKKPGDFPDVPSPSMTPDDIRSYWETPLDELMGNQNGLIDGLTANTGAGNLGAKDVSGNTSTIQAEMNKANNGLNSHKTATTLDHPDKSVVESKLGDASVSRRTIQAGAVGTSELDPAIMSQPNTLVGAQAQLQQVNEQLADIVTVNVKQPPFNATGTPGVDDTQAIQNAIDSISTGTILIPLGTYLRGNLVIKDKTDFRIIGYGSTHNLISGSNSSNVGIELQGTCDNVIIEGLHIVGDGTTTSLHVGFSNPSGQTLTNIKILNNKIENVLLGIDVNADQGGSINDITIQRNHIKTCVGVNPGQGYGIHVSSQDQVNSANVVIDDNYIEDAYRHSIYLARGMGFTVTNNKIKDHRKNATDPTNPRAAINLARSSDIIVDNNQMINCYTCGIMITPDTATYNAEDITISNNLIIAQSLMGIAVGSTGPSNNMLVNRVVINGNTVKSTVSGTPALFLYYGKNVIVENNNFNVNDRAIILDGEGESTGTTNYSDNWFIKNNILNSATGSFRINPGFANSNIHAKIGDQIKTSSDATFNCAVVVANPNIEVNGIGTDGLSWSSGIGLLTSKRGNGVSGSYVSGDATPKTVTVTNGLITKIQ